MEKIKKRWVRGSCVGRGAFGTVNLAVDLSNGDVFAVKSVDLGSALPPQIQALENEIAILKSISSPFIVGYLGDDTTSEGRAPTASTSTTTYRNLHMEYLPRGTAAAAASYDEEAVRSYTWCLVSALSYLHSRGIVHCDVKGKNVLLGPSPGSAKLADFGSAVESSAAAARGSPMWMAPEVMHSEYQGPESDVWSLGCTVVEMFTGKPAWDSGGDAIRRIGYGAELPLFPAGLSSTAHDFLEKCFRRDYKKRWSCDQLLRHPFISIQKNPTIDSSPRCVLDWFDNLGIGADESEREENSNLNLDAKERMRELVSGPGANWESNGWVVVRGGMKGEERTISEYSELGGIDEEVLVANAESSSNSTPTILLSQGHERNFRYTYDVASMLRFHCDYYYCYCCVKRFSLQKKKIHKARYKFSFVPHFSMNFDEFVSFLSRANFEFHFLILIMLHFLLLPSSQKFYLFLIKGVHDFQNRTEPKYAKPSILECVVFL